MLAGCLEAGGPDGAPPVTSPGTATPPATTPPAPPEPTPVPLDTLASGQQAQTREAARLVFTERDAFLAFWNATREDEQEPAPAVDFDEATAVAALLGPKPNGCWAVRMTNATDDGYGATTVEVTAYRPPSDQMCTSVITYPWHVASLPGAQRDVTWTEREGTYPPSG